MELLFSTRAPARYVSGNNITFSCSPAVQVKTVNHSINTSQLTVSAIMKEHENMVHHQKKQKSEHGQNRGN